MRLFVMHSKTRKHWTMRKETELFNQIEISETIYLCEKMSSDSFRNVIHKMYLEIIYLIHV